MTTKRTVFVFCCMHYRKQKHAGNPLLLRPVVSLFHCWQLLGLDFMARRRPKQWQRGSSRQLRSSGRCVAGLGGDDGTYARTRPSSASRRAAGGGGGSEERLRLRVTLSRAFNHAAALLHAGHAWWLANARHVVAGHARPRHRGCHRSPQFCVRTCWRPLLRHVRGAAALHMVGGASWLWAAAPGPRTART
eukprot:COSAG01_NODE_14680_length_1422_cov_2.089947_2_plen_191_part_00